MAPSKPRNSTFKDAVVAQMSLKAHFAIADNHPTDMSTPELDAWQADRYPVVRRQMYNRQVEVVKGLCKPR